MFSSVNRSPSSHHQHNHHRHDSSVTVGVAITAVAGVAVAAAVGGTLIYTRGSPFKRRKRKRTPLTEKQWRDAFDAESGRLVNKYKVLKRIRLGGIEPNIRAEVWPFLLGFFDIDSTLQEREAEKCRKRKIFEDLKRRCKILKESVICNAVRDSNKESQKCCTVTTEIAVNKYGYKNNQDNLPDGLEEQFPPKNGNVLSSESENVESTNHLKATENFFIWQRIIRLDAVRMNTEWIPYSPRQANVTPETACELASSVGLKDDEHLEPCRQHHAARLVGILEVYALYDSETGYCQGMSDLLSPFVALLDEDYEAFWCFVQFMDVARNNFRLDEAGIQRQLTKISKVFKAGDPHLYSHLENIDAKDCHFVYRMVVVLLRRELTFEQTISLWEVVWAERKAIGISPIKTTPWRKIRKKPILTDELILFVIAAAVRQKRNVIIQNCKGMDEILHECNSMAGHLDVWKLLDDARELVSLMHGQIPD